MWGPGHHHPASTGRMPDHRCRVGGWHQMSGWQMSCARGEGFCTPPSKRIDLPEVVLPDPPTRSSDCLVEGLGVGARIARMISGRPLRSTRADHGYEVGERRSRPIEPPFPLSPCFVVNYIFLSFFKPRYLPPLALIRQDRSNGALYPRAVQQPQVSSLFT